jgi:hypothetical protein
MLLVSSKIWRTVFANDNDAFIPEVWAQESLMILEANMVAAALVHRDFENEIANFGDVVNTRRPATFTGKRKTDADEVTVQDAQATNVPVRLDQHWHTSFLIKDGEESKSFKNLRDTYLEPALLSIGQAIDELVLMQMYRFIAAGNVVGQLGTAISKSVVISARETLNNNKVPSVMRRFVVCPNMEGDLLNIGEFTKANEVGDDGSALREGHLGRKFGFDFFMDQNSPSVATGSSTTAGAVDESDGYAAGSTTIAMDGHSGAIEAGTWCTIAGDMTPQKVTASVGGATPSSITISPGLKSAVANNAVITFYTPGAIDEANGYDQYYTKELTVDGFTVAPKVGQLVSFGAAAVTKDNVYGALSTPTTVELVVDRALAAAVSNSDVVGIGPAGDFGFAFHKNAVSLVTRPLAAPAQGTGALSSVASYNGLSIRVVITYDGSKQGHLVTVDILGGVEVLDENMGVCVLG